MKTIIISIFTLAYFHICHAENTSITETIAYKGKITDSAIFLRLSETNGSISGGYHYEKYGTAIPLRGSIAKNRVTLQEKTDLSDAKIIAELNNQLIHGVWRSKKSTHAFRAKALSQSYKKLISSIDTSSHNHGKQITITFKDKRTQTFEIEILTETITIIFEDQNFDGLPDMRVLENDSTANTTYIAWNYNPTKEIFEPAKDISTLPNPKILHSERAILSLSRDGCCHYIASKAVQRETHSAEFDYAEHIGTEHITNTKTKETQKKSIDKEYFEKKYLTPMGAEGL